MPRFSQQSFQNARSYIYEQGRALDARRFDYHFGNAQSTGADVLAALAPYQNEDGGFGHGLEPDLRTPASSAVATQQAFNIFQEIDAPATADGVQRAVEYLLNSLDTTTDVWPIVPPAVEDAPHAPWWEYDGIAQRFGEFKANPRAALVGHLHRYAAFVPDALLARLRTAVVKQLDATPAEEVDMHELHCYVTLVQAPNLPASARSQVLAKLRQVAASAVETDPAKWDGYVLMPLDVVPTPDSPLADVVPQAAIDAHLEWLIAEQQPDGSWPLPWSWEFVDADAWARAERDWKGQRAVNFLKTLRAHGCFE